MKKTLWIITCALLAQMASAQTPKWAANAKKAIFSIVTYDKDNNIKATGNGFYIDNKGTAFSNSTVNRNFSLHNINHTLYKCKSKSVSLCSVRCITLIEFFKNVSACFS